MGRGFVVAFRLYAAHCATLGKSSKCHRENWVTSIRGRQQTEVQLRQKCGCGRDSGCEFLKSLLSSDAASYMILRIWFLSYMASGIPVNVVSLLHWCAKVCSRKEAVVTTSSKKGNTDKQKLCALFFIININFSMLQHREKDWSLEDFSEVLLMNFGILRWRNRKIVMEKKMQ